MLKYIRGETTVTALLLGMLFTATATAVEVRTNTTDEVVKQQAAEVGDIHQKTEGQVEPPRKTMQESAREKAPIFYDNSADSLTLRVAGMTMEKVLGAIALQSGVEIQLDPEAAAEPVTMQFENQPLERGLKQLLINTSYAFKYTALTAENGEQRNSLIAVRVLPKGKTDTSMLRSVVNMQSEAVIRAGDRGEKPKALDLVEQRWQERLSRLPLERRQELEQRADERLKRREEQKARRDEKRKEMKDKRDERKAERDARLEQLRQANPELYEQRMQQREEARRQWVQDSQMQQ